uniref:Ankyrin repeat and LEM domain-containing protein 1 n=1 Tax=Hydra vulgaris TaxID=6087 RepID=T2M9X0_HYDVU
MQDSDAELLEELILATASRNISKVEELMQIGIDPCSPTREGICPIHTAVVLESPSGPEIVARMLKYGADPNTKTSTGLSPLHIAAMWGRVDTINVLLDNGADIADKDDSDMSALDYAEVADENKYACIDALTEFRGDVKRKSACFKTKSRLCLNRIKGKKNLINTESSPEKTNNSYDTSNCKKLLKTSSTLKNSIITFNKNVENIRKETLDKKETERSPFTPSFLVSKSSLKKDASTSMTPRKWDQSFSKNYPPPLPLPPQIKKSDHSYFVIETAKEFQQNLSISPGALVENSFLEDSLTNETIFKSCNETVCNQKISSTLLEDSNNKHIKKHEKSNNKIIKKHEDSKQENFIRNNGVQSISNKESSNERDSSGYVGDVEHLSENLSESSTDETFWSLRSSPMSPLPNCTSITFRKKKVLNTPSDILQKKAKEYSEKMFEEKEQQTTVFTDTKYVGTNSASFRDAASQAELSDIYNEVIKIRRESYVRFLDEKPPIDNIAEKNIVEPCDKHCTAANSLERHDKSCAGVHSSNFFTNNLHLQNMDLQFQNIHLDQCDVDCSEKDNEKNKLPSNSEDDLVDEENSSSSENLSESSLGSNFDEDLLKNVTVDYSNDSLNQFPNVSQLIHFYELKTDDEVLSARGTPTVDLSMVSKVYNEITIDYDWKDVSLLSATEEEHPITVPASILMLSCNELRQRLIKLGENPGPISPSTQKVYQRYLAKLEKQPDAQFTKVKETRFADYTSELRQILTGVSLYSEKDSNDLEVEMAYIFSNPEKHTWREGTQKASFNYLLLDPRVTKNLPDRSMNMTFVEQLRAFTASIFYIGKAKKSRPYEHLYDASKHFKTDKNKCGSSKLNMICDIWNSGMGVVSVHVFHSIIPVEAYTREGCMVDAMGLSRLTNAKRGEFYGPASSWNAKKRRLLGIHLLVKAMKIYFIEGEKQIRECDLTG